MDIQERLVADLKQAMRSGDKLRVQVIRNARAALQSAQIEFSRQRYEEAVRTIEAQFADNPTEREAALASISANYHVPLDAAVQQAVLVKEVKQRRDTAEIYRKAHEHARAEEEEVEARILEEYLPRQLSPEELRPQVRALIEELGLQGAKDMSKLMPTLMDRFKGRADGRVLSQLARDLLAE